MTVPAPGGPRRVWIDTDPGVGEPGADVDDGYAILQALRSPELEVVGISTVFGNAPVDVGHRIAAELLQLAGSADIPLYRGATSPSDLGQPTAATRGLAGALEQGPLYVLALGPLTNVATVLRRRPDLSGAMAGVVAVAGRRPGQRFLVNGRGPFPDFNLECDLEAARLVLAADIPVRLAGFEVATHVTFTAAHVERLLAGPPAARWLAERSRGWLELWADRFEMDGFHPFDALAVGVLASPALIVCEPLRAALVAGPGEPDLRGRPTAGTQLQVGASPTSGRPVGYASRAGSGFIDDLVRRLLTP